MSDPKGRSTPSAVTRAMEHAVFTSLLALVMLAASATAVAENAQGDPSPAPDLQTPIVEDASAAEREDLAERYATAGRRALVDQRYADAVRMLDASRRLAPRLDRSVHLADALERLGRRLEAARVLEASLSVMAEPDRGRREDLERRVERLRASSGFLSVRTEPEGAWLSLDGRLVGRDPLSSPLRLDPGEHWIGAEQGRLRAEARRISVSEGEALSVTLELEARAEAMIQRRHGLETALWTTTSLAAASAVAMVMVMVFDLGTEPAAGAVDLTMEETRRRESLRAATWGLVGATGALTTAAIALAVAHGSRERRARAAARSGE